MLAYWGFAQLGDEAGEARWLHALAGAILIVAGAYQFTSWKRIVLRSLSKPVRVRRHARFRRRRPRRAARRGRSWRVLPRLLLGADGRARRSRTHEPDVDGRHGRALLRREALEARPRAREGRRRGARRARRRGDRVARDPSADLASRRPAVYSRSRYLVARPFAFSIGYFSRFSASFSLAAATRSMSSVCARRTR